MTTQESRPRDLAILAPQSRTSALALLILPDLTRPAETLRLYRSLVGPVLRDHPSGNPWIMGSADPRGAMHVANRDVDIVVIGDSQEAENSLARQLGDARTIDDLDAMMRRLVELDLMVLARDSTAVRAQAPALLTRSFFWTRTSVGSVLSDEQLPLARLHDLALDPGVLVSRLTDAELSYPFSLHSIWKGVHTLRPGDYLRVRGADVPEHRTFWSPPEPVRRLAELAPELAAGLHGAIATRVAGVNTVSTDLSGGLDSTTLSFYTAEHVSDHHTFFMTSTHEENNDQEWALRAARELGSRHLTAPYQDAMGSTGAEDVVTLDHFPEGPSLTSASAAATPWIASELLHTGSTLHLNGHGGDALFGPVSTMLWSLFNSSTPGRFRRTARHCLLNRIPPRAAVRMLSHRRTLRSDLRDLAQGGLREPRSPQEEYGRWVVTPHLHPGIVDEARAHFASLVRRESAVEVEPLSPDRTVHQIVQFLSVHGTDVRRMNQASGENAPIYFDSPLLDVRVVDAALALNIDERTYQYPAKPLLAAARPAAMSVEYFLRQDKGDYSSETFDDHRAQRERIRALFSDGSELEARGLISTGEVLRSLDAYSHDGQVYTDVSYLETAERWLRTLATATPRASQLAGALC